jgi:hypothetical protein
VEENRHEFDLFEPADHVWDSIEQKLDQKGKKKINVAVLWKVAAIAFLVIAVPSALYLGIGKNGQHANTNIIADPEVQEMIEAEKYYSQEVTGKLAEIEKCYEIHPELKAQIESDLNELENMYMSLKKDLNDNMSNKQVIEAMIENNRNRMKLVDEILNQINC